MCGLGNLASAVEELLAADPLELPAAALGEEIVEIHKRLNRLSAAHLDRLVVFDRSGAAKADHGSPSAWLRAETRMSPNVSYRDVRVARDLADVLPATRAALRDGAINATQAQQIASLREDITDEALRRAEPHLADYASRVSTQELVGAIKHVKHMYGRRRWHATSRTTTPPAGCTPRPRSQAWVSATGCCIPPVRSWSPRRSMPCRSRSPATTALLHSAAPMPW